MSREERGSFVGDALTSPTGQISGIHIGPINLENVNDQRATQTFRESEDGYLVPSNDTSQIAIVTE